MPEVNTTARVASSATRVRRQRRRMERRRSRLLVPTIRRCCDEADSDISLPLRCRSAQFDAGPSDELAMREGARRIQIRGEAAQTRSLATRWSTSTLQLRPMRRATGSSRSRTSRRSGRPGRSARRASPLSRRRPSPTTTMRSARMAVDRRCAISTAVRPSSRTSRACLDQGLGLQVEVRRGLVEHEDPGLGHEGPTQGDQLALARGQRLAPLVHGVSRP